MGAPAAVPTARVTARRPGPARAAVAVAIFVGLTALRPWSAVVGPASPSPAPVPPVVQRHVAGAGAGLVTPPPDPSPEPSLLPDQIACNPGGWTIVSLDRMGPWTVRSWVPATPVLAAGPLDPRIRRLTLESPGVLAIGACSPSGGEGLAAGDGVGAARFVGAWRIAAGRSTPVGLAAPGQQRAGIATLYRPTDANADPAPPRWPAGVYVVEIEAAQAAVGTDGQRWFLALVVRGPA